MTDLTSAPLTPPPSTPASWLSRKTVLLSGALLLTLAGGTWAASQWFKPPVAKESAVQVQPIAVETLTIQPRSVAQTLELSGTIRPIEQAVLSTRVMGRITYLPVEAGDRIQKDQVVAEVNVLDMAAQTSQARSGVAQARAELARSQATLNQLQSQRVEAQAALKLAQIDQRRMDQLRAEGAISQERLDQSNTTLEQAKAKLAQVEAGSQQAEAAIAQAQAGVTEAEAGVTAASVSQSYGTVIAPFDGVVIQKLAHAGEMAAPGTPLLKIENPTRLELIISVPEENLRYVRVNQSVQVRVDAVNQTFNGVIAQIIPTSDPNSRSFNVKIPLNNSGSLISGMFGRIQLPTTAAQPKLTVPSQALIRRGQLKGVYVVQPSPNQEHAVALLRWVQTGEEQKGQIEITAGLTAGDRVIRQPSPSLSDGQAVEILN